MDFNIQLQHTILVQPKQFYFMRNGHHTFCVFNECGNKCGGFCPWFDVIKKDNQLYADLSCSKIQYLINKVIGELEFPFIYRFIYDKWDGIYWLTRNYRKLYCPYIDYAYRCGSWCPQMSITSENNNTVCTLNCYQKKYIISEINGIF
jgi:hypothetical protein